MKNLQQIESRLMQVDFKSVEEKIAIIRGVEVIADADVAALYGVETRQVNEAVRNNKKKFPAEYVFVLTDKELLELRSKISTTNVSAIYRVRNLKRELIDLHNETDQKKQKTKIQHFGEILTDIVMPDLQTEETQSTIEINFVIGKINHSVKRVRREEIKKQYD